MPLILALLAILAVAPGVSAQGKLEVLSSEAENRFPNGIIFRLEVETSNALKKATLSYRVGAEGSFRTAAPPFAPGRKVSVEHVLGSRAEGSYLHPNVEIAYTWSLEDTAGNRLETPLTTVVYKDTRFTWRHVERDGVRISWYRGGETYAHQLLDKAVADLRRAALIAGVDKELTVEVLVYPSVLEMRDALPWKSRDSDPKLPTFGLQVSPKTVLLLGGRPDTARTLAHELSHIAVRQGIGYIPSWLDEGLALLAEGDLAPEHAQALERAVQQDVLYSLQSMTEVPDPREPGKVWLFYGQAYSVARFIIETGGGDKLRYLMAMLKDKKSFDDALREVYGWNTDGLELDWRDSMGLPPHLGRAAIETEVTPEQALAQKSTFGGFQAFGALAASLLGLFFLFPLAILWLATAAFVVCRRKRWE
ncbi:MAG: hypothetical protein HYX92_21475 [Chloroflexi bacterium]|nr:hypothetical protein [Chloroflexota bacterium]